MQKYAISFLCFLLALLPEARAQFPLHLPDARELADECDTVRISFIGDVMMHSKQLEFDSRHFLKHINPLLNKADIAVANMEFSLGGSPHSGYPLFSAPDSYAETMVKDSGIDVMLIANNHILDRGKKGMRRTLAVYDSLGVRHTGKDHPLFISRKGIKIALINCTYGTNIRDDGQEPRVRSLNKEELSIAFSKAKAGKADFIIALPHWGEEYQLLHNQEQESWAGWMVGMGADAIIGTHPHVVQDSTVIDGSPVFYSLGNSISNMSAINTRLGLIVTLSFTINHISGETRMLPAEYDFSWCTLPGMLFNNYGTILIKEWATRRNEWLTPYDYDNMVATLKRVKEATGID